MATTNLFNSDVLVAFETAAITPELGEFRTQFEVNVQEMGNGMSAISDYISRLTSQWDNALGLTDVLERSIAAQNLAMIRMLPFGSQHHHLHARILILCGFIKNFQRGWLIE